MNRREARETVGILGGVATMIATYVAVVYLHRQSTPEQPLPTPIPIVWIEPTLTPSPPSTTEITVAFPSTTASPIVPMPEPAVPNHEEETFLPTVDALKRFLTGTEQIAIEGKSFEEFMKEKGYSFFIKPVPPKTGFVQPRIGLKTRELPIAEEGIKELDKKYWKQHEDKVLWSVEIIVEKNDGTVKERWAAMFMSLEIAGNPPAKRWVFNAIERKEGEKVLTFISPR